jgi:hypothetical protein
VSQLKKFGLVVPRPAGQLVTSESAHRLPNDVWTMRKPPILNRPALSSISFELRR